MKKIFLGIASLLAIATPVSAVVSCNNKKDVVDEIIINPDITDVTDVDVFDPTKYSPDEIEVARKALNANFELIKAVHYNPEWKLHSGYQSDHIPNSLNYNVKNDDGKIVVGSDGYPGFDIKRTVSDEAYATEDHTFFSYADIIHLSSVTPDSGVLNVREFDPNWKTYNPTSQIGILAKKYGYLDELWLEESKVNQTDEYQKFKSIFLGQQLLPDLDATRLHYDHLYEDQQRNPLDYLEQGVYASTNSPLMPGGKDHNNYDVKFVWWNKEATRPTHISFVVKNGKWNVRYLISNWDHRVGEPWNLAKEQPMYTLDGTRASIIDPSFGRLGITGSPPSNFLMAYNDPLGAFYNPNFEKYHKITYDPSMEQFKQQLIKAYDKAHFYVPIDEVTDKKILEQFTKTLKGLPML